MIEKIYEWLELSGAKFGDSSKQDLALSLIKEEFEELFAAHKANDNKEIKDAYIDIIWVLSNLTYFRGISVDELHQYRNKVETSNFSKFCKTEQEALDTIYNYENGTHWDKLGTKIDCTYVKVNDYYIVKRLEDGKILKSINYVKC